MGKYLDKSGTEYFWQKMKEAFATFDYVDGVTPIKFIENTDSTNKIPFRTLESGTYILKGYFTAFDGSSASYTFSSGMLVAVVTSTSMTYVQIFYPKNNTIQYLEVSDTDVTRNDAKLINMESVANKVTEVNEESDDSHYPSALAVFNAIPTMLQNPNKLKLTGVAEVEYDGSTAVEADLSTDTTLSVTGKAADAKAVGDAVGTVDTRLSTLIAALEEDIDTTRELEVVDIRTGYDGTTYELAGDAVRAIGNDLLALQSSLQDYIDKSAVDGLYYDQAESLLYLTSDGVIVSDPVTIVSGSGTGSGSTSTVKLVNENGVSSMTTSTGSDVVLKFTFTSTDDDVATGNGTCKITVNGVTKATLDIPQGLNSVNVKDYLSVGSNTVKVTCTDVYGVYKSITYTISVIEISVTSTFDDTVTYDGDITFKYIPYGLIEKTVHVVVDGEEKHTNTLSTSGKQNTLILDAMTHGVHTLDVYVTATLDGVELESEHLLYEIMCVETDNTTAMIASPFSITSTTQGEQLSIPYTVYDPTALACDITLTVYTMSSGSRVEYSTQTLTVDRTRRTWNTRRYPTGTVYFEIAYPKQSISRTHTVTVEAAKIDVQPYSEDVELALLSAGRSNSESNPAVWTSGDVTTTFSGINWTSTGWVDDENGDAVLRLNGDARAVIDYKPFAKDFRTYGKTIEMEFAIRDVNNRDAVVISCLNGDIGFEVTADRAYMSSQQTSVDCRFRDEEKVRVSFVVESTSEYRMMAVYLNGILSAAKQYPTNDNFEQNTPVTVSIGSSYCGVDIYTLRAYSTALSSADVVNNYIADTADVSEKVALYNANNIYDEYGNINYETVKGKIPVITIIGELPQSKGDKKSVRTIFEDPFNPDLNFDDDCTIDVQGTSSQYYVRKNWKNKYSTYHQHAPGQLSAKVFCLKVDYAEATGTHNTQNANLIETFYSEKIPPQETDERVRTTIYGFPIVIFNQQDETSDPVFYGKGNFNFDKGAENVFGFTDAYDTECWEFCNNTSNACLFKGEIPDSWGDDFEARYPEDYSDISRFKIAHSWVVSTNQDAATGDALASTVTYDGVAYTHDTAAYRLAKFKAEFEDHFDMHYSLIYYVYTFFALMVDQRAKNMFMTYWNGKWFPYFYDNDTCFGINNEGKLVFDYYHEDTDKLDKANVYNGQESTLWVNFRESFPDEIQKTYQSLRSDGKLTYDVLVDRFITQGSDKWSANMYNEDAEFKYVSMLKSSNDATNLPQVRGSGEEHFKYFIDNRLNYCDGKWYASDYANDYVSFRIYTPDTWAGVEPNADITVTPFSNMYAGVRYKANGTLQQAKVEKNTAYTFVAPDETFNDTETAVYGASQISSFGDLSPLYAGSIDVSKASKLVELLIGSGTEGYSNTNMHELSVGTNRLLKKIDIRNCPNLTDPLDLTGCPNIEEIYAAGTGITGIELAESGYVRLIQLPATLTMLEIMNQLYVEDFSMEGYDALKTLRIENCSTAINPLAIVANSPNLERVRITGANLSYETYADATELQLLYNYKGLDENGQNTDTAHISGTCHITSLTGAEYAEIVESFPYLTITYTNLTSQLVFMSEDGTTELGRQTINNGGDGTDPVAAGLFSAPTKESTVQYTYSLDGWSLTVGGEKSDSALLAVSADRYVYAHFAASVRCYTVYFYNGTTLLQTVTDVPYGGTATYTGSEPTKTGVDDPDDYPFIGWSPSPYGITEDTNCYAQFSNPYELKEIEDDWETIIASCADGTYIQKYSVGNYKPLDLGSEGTVNMQIAGINKDELADGTGYAPLTWISMELLATDIQANPGLSGSSGDYTLGTGTIGGWEFSKLRSYLKSTIKPLIPTTVANAIVEVTKTQPAYDTACSSFTQTTTDDVWLPSEAELSGSSSTYKTLFEDTNANRIKCKVNSSSASAWWLRSAHLKDSFHCVETNGRVGNRFIAYYSYVVLCFCT